MEDAQPQLNEILRQLQKVFGIVLQECEAWQKSHKNSTKHLDSIMNLAEQLQCVNKVNVSATPLAAFPGVKDRLMYKLAQAIEDDMQNLHDAHRTLHETQETMSKQNSNAVQFYKSNASKLTIEAVSKATVTRRSAATMLEWISDLDQLFYEQFAAKEVLLENLNYLSSESMENFRKEWPKCDPLHDKIHEVKLYTMLFLEEKL